MGFFSLNSSQWELSVVCQQIFSISYRFRDKRGQRGQKCDFCSHIKYLFFIQFWWDFFHWISLKESFRIVQPIFSIFYRFWDTRGPKGQKCDFWGYIKFLFFIQFWWDFFIGFLSMRAFRIVTADFFYLLPFSRYKGPKREC